MGYFESHVKKKFIEISSYIMNLEKSHTRDLTAHLNTAEQKETNSHRRTRCQEIIKLRTDVDRGFRHVLSQRNTQRATLIINWSTY